MERAQRFEFRPYLQCGERRVAVVQRGDAGVAAADVARVERAGIVHVVACDHGFWRAGGGGSAAIERV